MRPWTLFQAWDMNLPYAALTRTSFHSPCRHKLDEESLHSKAFPVSSCLGDKSIHRLFSFMSPVQGIEWPPNEVQEHAFEININWWGWEFYAFQSRQTWILGPFSTSNELKHWPCSWSKQMLNSRQGTHQFSIRVSAASMEHVIYWLILSYLHLALSPPCGTQWGSCLRNDRSPEKWIRTRDGVTGCGLREQRCNTGHAAKHRLKTFSSPPSRHTLIVTHLGLGSKVWRYSQVSELLTRPQPHSSLLVGLQSKSPARSGRRSR